MTLFKPALQALNKEEKYGDVRARLAFATARRLPRERPCPPPLTRARAIARPPPRTYEMNILQVADVGNYRMSEALRRPARDRRPLSRFFTRASREESREFFQ